MIKTMSRESHEVESISLDCITTSLMVLSSTNAPHSNLSWLDIKTSFHLLSSNMTNLRAGCVFLFATISLCIAQRSPSITYISEDQVVDVGGTVELSCSVQYGTEFSVIWLKTGGNKNDHIFLSTGTSLVVKESRFALLYDGASATYTVLIKDLQETDAGTYQCEVILSVNNKITALTHLSVRRPPIITDNSTSSIVTTEGEQIQMECFATGFPSPKIVWRRENNALLPTGELRMSSFGSIIVYSAVRLIVRVASFFFGNTFYSHLREFRLFGQQLLDSRAVFFHLHYDMEHRAT